MTDDEDHDSNTENVVIESNMFCKAMSVWKTFLIICAFALLLALHQIPQTIFTEKISVSNVSITDRSLRKNVIASPSIYNLTSWVKIREVSGNRIIRKCSRFEDVFIRRLYVASGATRLIQLCPPGVTTIRSVVEFDSGISMVKNDYREDTRLGGITYTFSGDILLNSEGGACDVHQDCKDGFFCNEKYTCQKLDQWACVSDRGDRDCTILNDSSRTKCYTTEDSLGRGQCSCDNDPSKFPCEYDQTCDFRCQVSDDVPKCESPRSRNLFCIAFTKNGLSECPVGGEQPQLCTRPPTAPPTRKPTTFRPTRV